LSVTVVGISWSFAFEILQNILEKAGCDSNFVLEFHETVDTHGRNAPYRWEEGLAHFVQENDKRKLYDCYINNLSPDFQPASISYGAMVSGEWYVVINSGANYYLGTGPRAVIKFREFCRNNKIKILFIEEEWSKWLGSHGYNVSVLEIPEKPHKVTISGFISDAKREINPMKAVVSAQWALVEILTCLARAKDIIVDESSDKSCTKLLNKLRVIKFFEPALASQIEAACHIRNKVIHNYGPIEKQDASLVISVVEELVEKYSNIIRANCQSYSDSYEYTTILPPKIGELGEG